ncbi:MAG: hypothetical protein CSB48_01970 [Proteobacteria bacterium]|nr:MAG: hypothetical protein CSB48_01970 [Pseudomonadota bacterium]PIE40371.1 MAG: hypothetical protein CSA51_01105 [Gammaproteobacteria bacterium]
MTSFKPTNSDESRSLNHTSLKQPGLSRSLFEPFLLAVTMIGVAVLFETFGMARKLDQIFYDTYTQYVPMSVPDNTVIIAVDEKSLATLGQWPWRRSLHAELVRYLSPGDPAAIIFDILFAEPDKASPRDDEILAKAMQEAGNVIIPVHIHPLSNRYGLSEIPPIKTLAEQAVGVGHAHVELDSDGIARGVYLREGMGKAYWPALSLAVRQWYEGEKNALLESRANTSDASPYINVREDYRLIPFSGGAGSIKTWSYIDVLSGTVPQEAFRDRFIFIGSTAAGLGDFLSTPVSGLSSPMSGVEFHANVFNALQNNQTIKIMPSFWQYLISITLVLVAVLMIPRIRPERTLPSVLLVLLTTCLFSFFMLYSFNLWFQPSTAIICIIIVYPLWTWRRIMQLNSFLNKELITLSKEPQLIRLSLENLKPGELIGQLAFLLQPGGWVLLQKGIVNKAEHYNGQTPSVKLEPGFWSHEGANSWIVFFHEKTPWTIGLFWDEDSLRDKKRAYLHRIQFSTITPADEKPYIPTFERLTRRIQQVQNVIQSMQHMRHFVSEGFDKMPDGVVVTDPIGGIIFANRHSEKLLNSPEGSLIGLPLITILSTLPSTDVKYWQDIFSQVLLNNLTVSAEIRLSCSDIMLQFAPFIPAEPRESGMIVNISDITTLKEEQRRKNETIDFLSHDLRSPLVSQLALLDNISRNEREFTLDLIAQIRSHAQRSMNLAEQFLQVARAEQTRETSFYECDLITIIYNALDSTIHSASQKHIQLEFEPDMDEAWTNGNPGLLERALINLIGNAIKYSPEKTKVSLAVFSGSKENWHIEVADQGQGIDEEEIPFIFDSFHRQKKTETEGNHGVGLGLRFVKIVIEKHNGTIDIESKVNRGTRFRIQLPQKSANQEK